MALGIQYADDYIVGGPPGAHVTPNFTLSEYARPDGRLFVHRELVAAIQVLRNHSGHRLKIASLQPGAEGGSGLDGRFAWLESQDARLAEHARSLIRDGWLAHAKISGARVYVEMPDPAHLPPIAAEKALDLAVSVTAAFETSGDPYQQVTGNFDQAGLSFGPLQVNLATGTLQELFRRFAARDAERLRQCFGTRWDEWSAMLRLRGRAQQVAWADALSRGGNKADFDAGWKDVLQNVGRQAVFRSETLRYAYDVYGRKLIVALAWLKGVRPIVIRNFRCLAALYDLCVQQGSLDKAHASIRRRIALEDPRDEFHLTRIAVEERGRTANAQWRADCISRRLCILERQPVKVSDAGRLAQRDNPQLYLLRNAPVQQMERYLA